MPKATVTLPSGAIVNIEGTPDEIKELLAFYGASSLTEHLRPRASLKQQKTDSSPSKGEQVSISEIVEHIKNCDDAENIENRILDTTSQVNRILLPLFILQKHIRANRGLTTGEISSTTKELGIPIHIANVSNALKGSAARYVIGDSVRKKGQPVRYLLSRRGIKYLENVIKGTSNGE